MKPLFWACIAASLQMGCATQQQTERDNVSGIYPKLAYYNQEGECGTGAVVPWANRLWVVTYGPHLPFGSSDKLYEITPDLKQIVHPESIGGTPANRMIHKESGQLFIGPYAIDSTGKVRTIPYDVMPGRHTGNARHLTDPAHKIYYATMEEGLYEVDVRSLQVQELYQDANVAQKKTDSYAPTGDLLPGVHGKGVYSGQGVVVFTNNGEGTDKALSQFDIESGVLAEWDGRDWKVVRRNQFTEVTGPGGIAGNACPESDPLWAVGWDYKSLILGVREPVKGWSFYRLPKASHSYDGAHGWNTEWPRIRNVGTDEHPEYLMTMHGLFWHFPGSFTSQHSAGIRPRSAYLKVIGDFARWNDRLVFGCDDTAQKEFLNSRKVKGALSGPGQSNSNLWFTSLEKPDQLGPATVEGAVWSSERIKPGVYSDPYLFGGWKVRCAWMKNEGAQPVTFTLETDNEGDNRWSVLQTMEVAAGTSLFVPFNPQCKGEWIRARVDKETVASLSFSYTDKEKRPMEAAELFSGLAPITASHSRGGIVYSLGDDRRALGMLATETVDGETKEIGYYEMGDSLQLVRKEDEATAAYIRQHVAIPRESVTIEKSSVLVIDDKQRRWRLPLSKAEFRQPTQEGALRICREVSTERDLFNCMGTFYELPAENADGFAKIRPIASHSFRINDYASYRGMLILTGVQPDADECNEHIIVSDDRKAAVWAGTIDDLWELGKPAGQGGPWLDEKVQAGVPSDPYLIAFYDRREISLSHRSEQEVEFRVEADPTGNGDWMEYATFSVKPQETFRHLLPEAFQARWIRFTVNVDAAVSAQLTYQ
ncbi:MAG: hypothetical protein ACI37U_08220 [Bacteroides sp.]